LTAVANARALVVIHILFSWLVIKHDLNVILFYVQRAVLPTPYFTSYGSAIPSIAVKALVIVGRAAMRAMILFLRFMSWVLL